MKPAPKRTNALIPRNAEQDRQEKAQTWLDFQCRSVCVDGFKAAMAVGQGGSKLVPQDVVVGSVRDEVECEV